MALTAVIGQACVVQVLFVDGSNQPTVVTNPRCTVFYLDATGTKQVVVDDQPMNAVGLDVGRFSYIFVPPEALTAGDSLYAEMSATDNVIVGRYFVEQQFAVVASPVVEGSMRTQFVRGG